MRTTLRLTAAFARSRDRFCIAIRETDAAAPASFVLSYDVSSSQPWGRIDVSRHIVSVIGWNEAGEGDYAAVSDEGDVYFFGSRAVSTERIPGAGVYSADSTGRGYIACACRINGRLYVGGSTAQLYRRDGPGAWQDIAGQSVPIEPGFDDLGFGFIGSPDGSAIYAGGAITVVRRGHTQEELLDLEAAAAAGDIQRMTENFIVTKEPDTDYTDQGRVYLYENQVWRQIPFRGTAPLYDNFIESPNKVWIVGSRGAIFLGNAASGFQSVGFHGDTERILSFTKFGDRYVAASEKALHWFNGHNLSSLRPTTVTRIATPLRVQAVDDVLFYFDYNQGVHRFDGKRWESIPIPPELLERDFKGLKRP